VASVFYFYEIFTSHATGWNKIKCNISVRFRTLCTSGLKKMWCINSSWWDSCSALPQARHCSDYWG